MRVVFIVPCFNMGPNFDDLVSSIIAQDNDQWSCIMIDDMSDDNTWKKISETCLHNDKFQGVKNTNKKFALKNIVDSSRIFEDRDDVIIAVIDGDDRLCNENTVSLLLEEYEKNSEIVWTAHKWDINGMNISKEMPNDVDPYSWPWCSSHLRTFKSSLLKEISNKNFKDTSGEWFRRGYDQALMLPLLKITERRKYLDEVCYLYNINSVSIRDRSWEEMDQISTINIVRARGFLE